jgi:hypothetical protein
MLSAAASKIALLFMSFWQDKRIIIVIYLVFSHISQQLSTVFAEKICG